MKRDIVYSLLLGFAALVMMGFLILAAQRR